ncbi:SMI1/KNR4 family protein [Phytomonospora endophytica]|uniref:SMI1/KNR4 family protein n=1 Tax=Phytomonospora endophytica TaxID=714109 RepID=A0A841FYL2_9ACTN|nr:SMI1/KNR4 family protein [Phytomonospora endophytica]MBB6039833.1 hypothetical protein [Phytomonospora endophytica]GIG70313.1 hypothetical protein Pen01_66080 [Phytomonospora endophytica]
MDFARALSSVADGDRATAWTFLRDYADWCGRPLTADDGLTSDPALPAALREAYALLGRRDDLTANQDRLLAPGDLRTDGEFVVFREENQWVCEWGFRRETGDDPAVLMRTDTADPAGRGWEPFIGRLSHAVVDMVLSETLLLDDECTAMGELADGDADRLRETFPALRFPAYEGVDATWHGADGVILRLDGDSHALVRASDREVLDAAIERVDAEWTYVDEL